VTSVTVPENWLRALAFMIIPLDWMGAPLT